MISMTESDIKLISKKKPNAALYPILCDGKIGLQELVPR